MSKHHDNNAEQFFSALGGDYVEDIEESAALTIAQMLATREWFDRRRKELTSSGGRPSNPDWALKRLIPFAPRTWETLKELAESWSEIDRKVSPGQLAALVLDEAINQLSRPSGYQETALIDDPFIEDRLRSWRMPELFAPRSGRQVAA